MSYSPAVTEVASSTTAVFTIASTGTVAVPKITLDLPYTFSIDYMALCTLNGNEQVYAVSAGPDSSVWTATFTQPATGALTLSCENFHVGQAEAEEPKGTVIVHDGSVEKSSNEVVFPAITPFTIAHVSALTTPHYQLSEGVLHFEIPDLLFTIYINDTIEITLPTATNVSPGYYIHPIYSHCSTGSGSRYTAKETEPGPVLTLIANALMPPMSEVFYIDCENVTTSAAHSGFQSGSMTFFAGDSSTGIKRGHAANITYAPVSIPTLGGTISRAFPASLEPGSTGWLTLALRPLPVDVLKGDKLVVTVPNAWAVGAAAPTDLQCKFSLNVKQPEYATLSATGAFTSWPAAGSGKDAELTVTFGADAPKTVEGTLYVHCNKITVPAAGTTAAAARASLVSTEFGVLANSRDIALPEITGNEAGEVLVTMSFSLLSKDVLSVAETKAVENALASITGVAAGLARIAHQTIVKPADGGSKDTLKRLSFTAKVRVPASALYEDVHARLQASNPVARIRTALGGTEVTVRTAAQVIEEEARCWNTIKDFDETDPDCGGEVCSGCALYGHCQVDKDCSTGDCRNGKCTQPNAASGASSAVVAVVLTVVAGALMLVL